MISIKGDKDPVLREVGAGTTGGMPGDSVQRRSENSLKSRMDGKIGCAAEQTVKAKKPELGANVLPHHASVLVLEDVAMKHEG